MKFCLNAFNNYTCTHTHINMGMNKQQIIEWGMNVPAHRPVNRGIMRLIEYSRKINCVKCRVCRGRLGETPECSYCEHKRDELGFE